MSAEQGHSGESKIAHCHECELALRAITRKNARKGTK